MHQPTSEAGSPAGIGSRAGRTGVVAGLAATAASSALLTVLIAVGSPALQRFDTSLTGFTRSWADSMGWPVCLAAAIGHATQPAWCFAAAALVAVVLLRARYTAAAGLLALSGAIGVAVTTATKLAIGRERPPDAGAYVRSTDTSFPSGHSSVGIYLILATGLVVLRAGQARERRALVRAGRAIIVFGPLLGVTRLILGAHWPTDILAGWAFGSTALCAAALLLWDRLAAGWTSPPTPSPPSPSDTSDHPW